MPRMETAVLEKRRHYRHNVLCAVIVAPNGHPHEGFILDLSEGGARVVGIELRPECGKQAVAAAEPLWGGEREVAEQRDTPRLSK